MRKKDIDTRFVVQALIASLLPAAAAWSGPVNVNTADAGAIAKELSGIGPAKAAAIVEYRQKNGPFRTPEDLLKVEGIGQKVLDQNKANIRLDRAGGGSAPAADKPATKSTATGGRGPHPGPAGCGRPGFRDASLPL
ncbi:MAG: ComEA family DNA-binding protein [Steroidobacteraceae bacterium]